MQHNNHAGNGTIAPVANHNLQQQTAMARDYFHLLNRNTDAANIDFLMEEILPRKGIGVLMGPTGSGKRNAP